MSVKKGRPKLAKGTKGKYSKKKQEMITEEQLAEWKKTKAKSKMRQKGTGSKYMTNKKADPIKHNNRIQEMIRILNTHNGSMDIHQILETMGHLRKKIPIAVEDYLIEDLPLRMKRLRKSSVQFCLATHGRFSQHSTERQYEFIATYCWMDLYYHFYSTDYMLYFKRPFKVEITLHLNPNSYSPVGEYAYMLQKIYYWAFRYYNLIPYHGKFYFVEWDVKVGSVGNTWDEPTYDIRFKILSNSEIRKFYKKNVIKSSMQKTCYEHNAMKKLGLMDLSARPKPKLWAKKYRTKVVDNDEEVSGLTQESRDYILENS